MLKTFRPPQRFPFLAAGLLAAGLLAPALGAYAAGERTVLGAGGQPVRLLQDAYGDLFPVGSEASPHDPVLALEQTGADGKIERTLVPGTAGPELEVGFSLLYDKTSDRLFVFWESRHSESAALYLTYRTAERDWADVTEISDDSSSWKSTPELAVTRNSLDPGPGDEGTADHRSVVHLVWAEEGPGGERVLLAPVVLRNGTYLGTPPVLDLHDLLPREEAASVPEPLSSLLDAPALLSGRDDRTVLLAYTDLEARRLVTVEIESLPVELSALAGGARAHINVFGARSTVQSIADTARAHINVFGQRLRFHPAVVSHVAERAYEAILAAGNQPGAPDFEHLGEVAWSEIVRAATGFEDRGLMDSGSDANPSPSRILELGQPDSADGSSPTQLLRIRRIASWPAPATPEVPIRLFVSPSGREVVVAWAGQGRIEYRETEGRSWSELKYLELSGTLSPTAAYELLEQRVRSGG